METIEAYLIEDKKGKYIRLYVPHKKEVYCIDKSPDDRLKIIASMNSLDVVNICEMIIGEKSEILRQYGLDPIITKIKFTKKRWDKLHEGPPEQTTRQVDERLEDELYEKLNTCITLENI